MLTALASRLSDWFTLPRAPESGVVVLGQRRVYILPTRHGMLFAIVLVMMLLGAINYGLSLGFVLTFLLVAMAFNGMLYTFRNLVRLHVSAGRAPAVFAGGNAHFTLNLTNPGEQARHAVGLSRERRGGGDAQYTDIPPKATVPISVTVPATRRGKLRPGRLALFTRFPLGLYNAWSVLRPDMHCIVYPRPAPAGQPLPAAEASQGIGAGIALLQNGRDVAGPAAQIDHPGRIAQRYLRQQVQRRAQPFV